MNIYVLRLLVNILMKNRLSYEYKNFSQNLEDGIIHTMISRLIKQNFTAIEIGSGNGTENMLRNLIENHGYNGIGHDMLDQAWFHPNYTHNVKQINLSNIKDLINSWPTLSPDFFSLDIDSIDFWILKELLSNKFFPSIICTEYLSFYGPNLICSVKPNLDRYHIKNCGASLSAFKTLLSSVGYKFLTVDTRGVNAFFYLPDRCKEFDDLKTFEFIMCKRHWNIPIPDESNQSVEFDHQILLG